jgi:5-methylcytosine-specific restriction endonuclease McrA
MMWATTYEHKNVIGVIVSGGMGYKKELVGFDVGDEDMVNLILKRDPAIFDFLVDAVLNVKDLSELMWASEGYYVNHIMCEKYPEREALKERIKHLISVAPKYGCEQGAVELEKYLEWVEEQEVKNAYREKARAKAKIVRRDFQKDYDGLFMLIGRRDGFCCVECGTSTNLTIDHKLAVINGGTNDPENLQMMCKSHNSKKGAR